MKRTLSKALTLLLTLALCAGLLPAGALAAMSAGGGGEVLPTVAIVGTPLLIKGDYQYEASDRTPFLSVDWNYGDCTLYNSCLATVSVWADSDAERPENYWTAELKASGSEGSFHGKLSKAGDAEPSQIYSNCMVRVELLYNGVTYSATQKGVATVQDGSDYQEPFTVAIEERSVKLVGGDAPALSVNWKYNHELTGDFSGMVYAWKDEGNGNTPPSFTWYQAFTDADGGDGDGFSGALLGASASQTADELTGDCWVQVMLSPSAQATVRSEPVKVTLGGSSGEDQTPPTITTGDGALLDAYEAYKGQYFSLYLTGGATRGGKLTWSCTTTDAYNTSGEDMGLPSGLRFSPNEYNPSYAYIVGTPEMNTRAPMVVSVTLSEDADGVVLSTTKTFTLTVDVMKPQIRTTKLKAPLGEEFSLMLEAKPAYGEDSLMWAVASDSGLPSGVTLDRTSGTLSGLIEKEGVYSFYLVALEITPEGVTQSSQEAYFTLSVFPAPTAKPTVTEVVYYDKDPDPNSYQPDSPAAWFLFEQGSDNLEAFALTKAASEREAANRVFGYPGFEIDGQWYRVAGLWTISSDEIIEKGGGERAVSVPLYFSDGDKPRTGTTFFLALWDYEFNDMSNLIELTAPAVGGTAEGSGQKTLAISTASFPDGTVGERYTATLSGTAANGGALSWSLSSGALPRGLSLNATGSLSGTPTFAGVYSFTLTLTEAGGDAVSRDFTLTVHNPAPKIATATLSGGVRGIAYSAALEGVASGGGALSWSISGGSLPAGLTLGEDGVISGTPTQSGSFAFTAVLAEAGIADTSSTRLSISVREPRQCQLAFSLNGGTAAPGSDLSDKVLTETASADWNRFTLPAAPTKDGYDFDCWRYGGMSYEAGATVSATGSMTFVAQWTEKPAVSVTYDGGPVVGSYSLRGKVGEEESVYLWGGHNDTPDVVSPEMSIPRYYLRNYTFESIGLWAYVNGEYTEIAVCEGDPAEQTAIALTKKAGLDDLSILSGVTVTAGDDVLTRNADYYVNSVCHESGRSLYPPCMTTYTDGFTAYVYGNSSSAFYSQYIWKRYDGISLADGVAVVTLEPIPAGVTVSGTVTFGGKGLSGARVLFSQYAYGQSLNFSAVTDSDGAYTITGLQPNTYTSYFVYYGEQELYSGTIYSNEIPGDFTKDIQLNTAVARLQVDLDLSDSDLPSAVNNFVRNNVLYGSVEFRDADSNVLGTNGLTLNYGRTYYIYNVGEDAEITYTISGTGIEETSGTFRLSGGVYSSPANEPIIVKPAPGVVARVSSPTYCQYALAWFDGGSFVGASNPVYCSSNGSYVYAPSPSAASGDFTVALVPYAAVGALTTLGALGDNELKLWSVTLSDNEIEVLEPFAVSKAASQDAAYVTKPNSTLTADKDAFAATTDLIRFTGSIGLDSGLENGRLDYLNINVRNDVDNVNYSNTAPVQYVVLNGKLYDVGGGDGFSLSSYGYYYRNGLSIELPCEYTIYCRPGDLDWDMQLSVYAAVSYSGGYRSDQLIGSATVKKPGASITTLSTHVCSDEVSVKGTTVANGSVDVYDGDTLIATATANAKGLWSARVTLAGTDSQYASTHVLTSRTASGARSEDLYVFHDPNGPELTGFRMAWNKYGSVYEINVGDAYTYAGGMFNVTFTAAFKNPEKLRATVYGTDEASAAKVAFVYYLTNGTVGTVYAEEESDGVFTAALDHTLYSSVAAAEVLYDPILNQRPVSEDGAYALTETDLAGAADRLDEAMERVGEVFTGEDALDYSADDEELAALNLALSELEIDATVRGVACKVDDDTGLLAWMNDAAADWLALPAEQKESGVGVYNKTMTFADKADYDAQLALLGQYADRKNLLQSGDSAVTGGQFYFTDIENDETVGTYQAEFDVYSDTARHLFVVNAALMLKDDFTGYKAGFPTGALALASAENAVLLGWWDDWTSSKSNVSTTEMAIKKYVDEKDWSAPVSNNQYDAAKAAINLYTDSKEHIDYNANSEMNNMQMRINAGIVMNSKEMQEINNYKEYLKDINGYNPTLSTTHEDIPGSPPTILDRLNQMQRDYDAMRADEGGSLAESFKFGLETARSLEALAGVGDVDNSPDPMKLLKDTVLDVTGIVCDKLALDKELERLDRYNRFMENWNYIQNWYDQNYGFGYDRENQNFGSWLKEHGGETGGESGVTHDDTDRASGSRAKEMAERNEVRKPPITNKVSNDPSGVVFEGVIENPVEGATVTLYYAATAGGDVVKEADAATATQLLPADGVDDLIPASPVQLTGADGRYSWGVPEGLWYVTAQYGGMTGSSDADAAATVSKSVGAATRLLPVLPVQLDVNIPLVDATAPYVTEETYTNEGVQVSFSKYMDEATCLDASNYTLTVNGAPAEIAEVVPVEQGTTPANLGEVTSYTRTVLLRCDSLSPGDAVSLTVDAALESYAGTPMDAAYSADGVVEGKVEVVGAPDGGELSYTVFNAPEDALLIAARYDDGRLTDVQSVAVVGSVDGVCAMQGTGTAFKLMLVDKTTFLPLCEAWEN